MGNKKLILSKTWFIFFHALAGEDELFGQFFGALEKIHYFKSMPDGKDDHAQLDRATHIFHNAVDVMFYKLTLGALRGNIEIFVHMNNLR